MATLGILSDGKDNKFHISETITWAKGRHFLRLGANGVRYQQNRFYSGNNGALGSFGYTATFTGSSFSDFLLDQVSSKRKGTGRRATLGPAALAVRHILPGRLEGHEHSDAEPGTALGIHAASV